MKILVVLFLIVLRAYVFEAILLLQSKEQPQGGRVGQPVKVAGATFPGSREGVKGLLLRAVSFLFPFPSSAEPYSGIGWWPIWSNLKSSGCRISLVETYCVCRFLS